MDHVLFPISIFTSLTSVNWSILIDDLLCLGPGIVEPDGAVSQIVVFSSEILGKQGAIRKAVGIGTIERVASILMSVVTIP